MIPLYMAYLAGNARKVDEDGTVTYRRGTVLLHTLCFVVGVSVSFFILGLGFSALGSIVKDSRDIISKIGGIIIIILGLSQMGILKIGFLNREYKLSNTQSKKPINPVSAFVMGFVFSFAWTPCVGPALASVLILASNASSVFLGNMLVLVYAIGFVIPFVGLGLFTGQVLNFIKKRANAMKYVVKVGGVILVLMGLMLTLGIFGRFEALFNGLVPDQATSQTVNQDDKKNSNSGNSDETDSTSDSSTDKENKKVPMLPIKLKDQNGNEVDVSKFKGKTVFVNFFATWCPPCRAEIPDIQALYEDNGYNKKDVIVLGVASPGQNREQDIDGVKNFIKENKIEYPVLMDETGHIFQNYQIYSLPTTFLIDKDSNIYTYLDGGLSREIMDRVIADTKVNKKYE